MYKITFIIKNVKRMMKIDTKEEEANVCNVLNSEYQSLNYVTTKHKKTYYFLTNLSRKSHLIPTSVRLFDHKLSRRLGYKF